MPAHKLNEIYTGLDGANDTGLRFVLDIGNTLNDKTESACTDPPPTIAPFKDGISVIGGMYEAFRLWRKGLV